MYYIKCTHSIINSDIGKYVSDYGIYEDDQYCWYENDIAAAAPFSDFSYAQRIAIILESFEYADFQVLEYKK